MEEQQKLHQPLIDDLARVERLFAKKEKQLNRLVEAYLDDVIYRELLREKKHDLEQEIKNARLTKADLQHQLREVLILPEKVKTIDDLGEVAQTTFKNGIPQNKFRELIETLDIKIELENAGDGMYVHITSILLLQLKSVLLRV